MNSFLLNLIKTKRKTHKYLYLICFLFILLNIKPFLIYAQQNVYKTIREYKYADLTSFAITTDNDSSIFLPLEDGKIKSIKLNGEVNWQTDLGGYIDSDLFYSDKSINLIIANREEKYLTSLSSETGIVISKKLINASDNVLQNKSSFLKLETENSIVKIEDNNSVSFYDKSKEKRIWTKKTGGNILTVQTIQENLLISATDNFLYYLRKKNGKLIWKYRFQNNVNAPLIISDKYIISTISNENKLYFVEITKGKLLEEQKVCENCYITKPIINLKENLIIQSSNSIILLSK